MILSAVIGRGSVMGAATDAGSAWIIRVSLTLGLTITSLAYAIGHDRGGHIAALLLLTSPSHVNAHCCSVQCNMMFLYTLQHGATPIVTLLPFQATMHSSNFQCHAHLPYCPFYCSAHHYTAYQHIAW